MNVRFALLVLISVLFLMPAAHGQCVMNQVEMAYTVCTQWWDGTTTCHWQLGWFDVYSCGIDVYGGGGGGAGGGGGGYDPEPPFLEIKDISDANPGQPLLRINENDAVVETTLAYDGNVVMTTGKTDVLFLSSLADIESDRIVTVQARKCCELLCDSDL